MTDKISQTTTATEEGTTRRMMAETGGDERMTSIAELHGETMSIPGEGVMTADGRGMRHTEVMTIEEAVILPTTTTTADDATIEDERGAGATLVLESHRLPCDEARHLPARHPSASEFARTVNGTSHQPALKQSPRCRPRRQDCLGSLASRGRWACLVPPLVGMRMDR